MDVLTVQDFAKDIKDLADRIEELEADIQEHEECIRYAEEDLSRCKLRLEEMIIEIADDLKHERERSF